MIIKYLLPSILLFQSLSTIAQYTNPQKNWESKLISINNQVAESLIKKDVRKILSFYNDSGIVCMPEFHKPLYTKDAVDTYYKQLFEAITIKNYKRTIYEVQQLEYYLVEIGNFKTDFTKAGTAYTYNSKYLNVWKIKANSLVLISEIWGSNTYTDPAVYSFIKIPATTVPVPDTANLIIREVNARNNLLSQFVANREGEKHATEIFSEDAIYLTYDTSMLVGMKNIKPYFTEHEKPGAVSIDSIKIQASRMIPLKKYVIEYGYYYVDASWDNKKGHIIVTGKSTNIWKRENGKLMMYRQMVNHD